MEMKKHNKSSGSFIRLGGLAITVGILLHIFLNVALKVMPPENPTVTEIKTYLLNESSTWAIIHGFRYIAFTCIILYTAALFTRTCTNEKSKALGWGIVGLLGAALFVASGIITNGLEMYIMHFLEFSGQADLFNNLFRLTRILFNAEVILWSILILGFSMAGLNSGSIPKWISILGFINVMSGLFTAGFIVAVVNGDQAVLFADIAAFSGLAWFICSGIFMLVRGNS